MVDDRLCLFNKGITYLNSILYYSYLSYLLFLDEAAIYTLSEILSIGPFFFYR